MVEWTELALALGRPAQGYMGSGRDHGDSDSGGSDRVLVAGRKELGLSKREAWPLSSVWEVIDVTPDRSVVVQGAGWPHWVIW